MLASELIEAFECVVVAHHILEHIYLNSAHCHVAKELQLNHTIAHAYYVDAKCHQPYYNTEKLSTRDCSSFYAGVTWLRRSVRISRAVRARSMVRHKVDRNWHFLVVATNLYLFQVFSICWIILTLILGYLVSNNGITILMHDIVKNL